ncbi:MAG: WecB/TagA/CpsF family glycosyltransferase [Hyphomicrobiaceae bacterium]|nr:WecB/TagA/CpsF family glycosyltransferase [Hyphomicrobiaceae bacterium]
MSNHPTELAHQPALAEVDGWAINVATLDDAVAKITAAIDDGAGFSVVTLNLDHLVKLRGDAQFREAYRAARFVSADGAPVARLARRQCAEVQRTTGADLLVPLCRAAADRNHGVYLFGSDDDAIARSARHLDQITDGRLTISGTGSPTMSFDPRSAEADAAIDRIGASGARLVFVALGAPKQEIFAARAVNRGVNCGFVCVGAALDFLAGRQIRAPRVFRDHGLEWLWRLSLDPARLSARYARCAMVLMDLELLAPRKEHRGLARRL